MHKHTAGDPSERVAFRPAEFARAAGLGVTTVYERIAVGDIPAVRLGTALMIPATWVNQFLAGGQPSK